MTSQAKLMNTGLNVVGTTAAFTTMYGHTGIGCTGSAFDISSTGTGGGLVTIGTIGTGNVAIGNTGSTLVTTGTIDIGPRSATINIGNTGTGAVTRFNTPITLGPAPTSNTHIGWTETKTLTANLQLTGSTLINNYLTSSILPIGVWLVSWQFRLVTTSGTSNITSVDANVSVPAAGVATGLHIYYGAGGNTSLSTTTTFGQLNYFLSGSASINLITPQAITASAYVGYNPANTVYFYGSSQPFTYLICTRIG